MSDTPVAGTFRLDGMIQGPAPDVTIAGNIESWAASAQKGGLQFHVSIDGPNFSAVPAPAPQRTSALSRPELDAALCDALNALLSLLPAEVRSSVFSTIRSEEFRPGHAVQTIYAVGPDGTIDTEQRTVEIDTEDPPPEITITSIKRAILPALVVLLLALLVSSFFIDYRKLWSDAKDSIVPLAKEDVTLEHDLVSDYVKVELTDVDNKRKVLLLKLTRGAKWKAAIESTPETTETWSDFANRLAIHQGRLRVELWSKKGKLIQSGELNVLPLLKKDHIETIVPARLKDRVAKIVVRP